MRTFETTNVAALAVAAALCLIIGPAAVYSQENAQLQIPPSLVECYNTSYFMNRENRLPMSIESLITIIEKVENTYGLNMDIRQLSVALLHRFRQDGIQRAPGVTASPGVIPYSPIGFQFPKFRILLSRLIPGSALNFPNSTLTREERCSLHFMLSSSFDTRIRGDENQVCNRLAEYRAQRLPREAHRQEGTNFMGDVEILENIQNRIKNRGVPKSGSAQVRSNLNNNNNNGKASSTSFADYDFGWETDYGYSSLNPNSISQCPVENGVIWTPWGTISAGTLIAGIAAGLQPQNVQLRTLLALSRSRPGAPYSPQTSTVNVDNRWAATLAGDLAEVALVQVPVTTSETASVGAKGGWNSTVMPKWYFLQQRQNLEMTDAEIRGGLDGLIIAMNIANWRTQAPSMTLSQLLRMYYSTNGVLGSGIMACNRQDNFATVAPIQTIISQTSAFAQVLDREMQLRVTLSPDAIATFSTSAANALTAYIPQYMNDVSCLVSNALPQGISTSITAMTNLFVYLDTSWQYSTVVDYVNYILQRLNINPYASSVMMMAASDGSVMVNRTHYLSNVYAQWNYTTHQMYATGFNLPAILRSVQNVTQNFMNEQKTNNSVGGLSMVALLIPNMAMVGDADSTYAVTQLKFLSEQVPDLEFVYYGGGSMNRFNSFVQNPATDIFQLTPGSTNVGTSSEPVVQAIKKIPRRLINPRCGANWYSNSYGTDQLAQYISTGHINFYRMSPNYFFKPGSGRYVSIQSQNSLQFTVCSSRSVVLPQQNSTTGIIPNGNNDQNCVPVSGMSWTYDLSSACNGYSTIHQCPPLYLSVQTPSQSTNGGDSGIQTVSCSDAACQTPDQARYIVSVINLECNSGVATLMASLAMMAMAFVLSQLMQ